MTKGRQGIDTTNESVRAITDADSKAMIELVAGAGDPIADIPLIECQCRVFQGISRLVAASTWMWLIGQVDVKNQDVVEVVARLDGGWRDDRERNGVLAARTCPDFQNAFRQSIHDVFQSGRGITRLREQIIDDKAWYASPGGKRWLTAGMDQFIISFVPVNESAYSTISFHRRAGEATFSPRERTIVEVLIHGIGWLHRIEGADNSLNDLMCLTPRERQVLSLLLKGCARKDVAAKLSLSQHTVADHSKVIYRKLGVSSRSELLAKFISRASELA